MSGPYDVPDDPDEVTLWAGRLRAWPTRPSAPVDADEIDEDTAVSARLAAGEDTVRVARDAPVGDTVRVVRDAPGDDTVRVTRDAPTEDTVQVRQVRPAPEPESAPSDVPADETVRVARERRAPDPSDGPAVDETTAPGRRRATGPAQATPASTEDEASTVDDDTATGTRRSTSRDRAETPEILSGDPAPVPRAARVPVGDHELYRPRADEAIRVTRAVLPVRPTDAPDAAEVRPRTPRRARIRGLVLAVTVAAVVVAAAITLFLLMG